MYNIIIFVIVVIIMNVVFDLTLADNYSYQ